MVANFQIADALFMSLTKTLARTKTKENLEYAARQYPQAEEIQVRGWFDTNDGYGNVSPSAVLDVTYGRDVLNRINFDGYIDDIWAIRSYGFAELDRLAKAHPEWTDGSPGTPNPNPPGYYDWKKQWEAANKARQEYDQVRQALESNDGLPRFLGIVDDEGHAAVSINNPDIALRNATFVPGTG